MKELEKKKEKLAKKMAFAQAKEQTKGIHQLGIKDEPRHKTLNGKEVKY